MVGHRDAQRAPIDRLGGNRGCRRGGRGGRCTAGAARTCGGDQKGGEEGKEESDERGAPRTSIGAGGNGHGIGLYAEPVLSKDQAVTSPLKVRIGIGLGTLTTAGTPDRFNHFVDRLEELGFDSLWMSERIGSTAPDPLIALAVAAGRTEKLKLGTSVLVLPGRNPVLLAKELATLDVLSNGRLLPAVGLGSAEAAEHRAFGVQRAERGRRHDEALALMRACWSGELISHEGEFYPVTDVQVLPRPVKGDLEVWLGGIAPSELRRVGRVGDGWLPSFCSPDDIVGAMPVIEEAATAAGRSIDPQHIGALIPYCDGELPSRIIEMVQHRRPDLDPRRVIPTRAQLPELIGEFVAVGASKFVVLPLVGDADPDRELGVLADELLPLET